MVQLADASLVSSSAYIYLLQTENIGGTEAAEFFKELVTKDRSNTLIVSHKFRLYVLKLICSCNE